MIHGFFQLLRKCTWRFEIFRLVVKNWCCLCRFYRFEKISSGLKKASFSKLSSYLNKSDFDSSVQTFRPVVGLLPRYELINLSISSLIFAGTNSESSILFRRLLLISFGSDLLWLLLFGFGWWLDKLRFELFSIFSFFMSLACCWEVFDESLLLSTPLNK